MYEASAALEAADAAAATAAAAAAFRQATKIRANNLSSSQ